MRIYIRPPYGKDFSLQVHKNETVEIVKILVESQHGIPPSYQRLDWAGWWLEDLKRLSLYNIREDAVIHLRIRRTHSMQ